MNLGDWLWLYNRISNRVTSWYIGLLFLGGRFTLVKAVLEAIPVHWQSLAYIIIGILQNIRISSFSLLWTGQHEI